LSFSFTRLIWKEPSFDPFKKELLQFFNSEEDGIILFSTLIKKFIEISTISLSPQDLDVLKEISALNKKNIQAPFFKGDENSTVPAFLHSLIHHNDNKLLGVVHIHPFLIIEFQALESLTFNKTLYLPMLCPAKKWTSPEEGGYMADLKPLVITSDMNTTMKYMNQAHQSGQLNSIYSSLDKLGTVAWAINSRVFSVVKEVMDYDCGYMSIPPKISHLDMNDENYNDKKGQRIEYNLISRVASCFDASGDVFYLPHNVDFRGRAYPMVSLLSHYQEDLVRSIMMFWYSQPLGKEGFNWIKYQLAGAYGKDKLGFQERIQFVNENIELILDSANRPLNGKMWWKKGEKPWQTLALCIEINLILEFEKKGNDTENYLCRIPIHQDGSCNGLQHYAALGADLEGGKSVNLVSIDCGMTRGDVYTTVLEAVKMKVSNDCVHGSTERKQIAILANTVLSRKLIKQTVMTTVYGVTAYGGTNQIYDRISDVIENCESNSIETISVQMELIKSSQTKISLYLSRLVLSSVSELFAGAKLIQEWLLENCFRVIYSLDLQTVQFIEANILKGKQFDFMNPLMFKPMMWTTLSGFPVVQVYKNMKEKQIPTSLQSITIKRPNEFAGINKQKQMNGIAPNFIHSIDALHMLMTCTQASRENVTFVSVHDSFWTYPHTATKLSSILKEEFIRLHSSDIIENLKDDLIYTTRKSFQLVWVKNTEKREFVNELNQLRHSYSFNNKNRTNNLNQVLRHELEVQSISDESIGVLLLLQKHDVPLYIQTKRSRHVLKSYSTKSRASPTLHKLLLKDYTPLLAPVRVLECPPKGNLDITEVRNSPYFFS
jgi:DNA-directed RNA polymerase